MYPWYQSSSRRTVIDIDKIEKNKKVYTGCPTKMYPLIDVSPETNEDSKVMFFFFFYIWP